MDIQRFIPIVAFSLLAIGCAEPDTGTSDSTSGVATQSNDGLAAIPDPRVDGSASLPMMALVRLMNDLASKAASGNPLTESDLALRTRLLETIKAPEEEKHVWEECTRVAALFDELPEAPTVQDVLPVKARIRVLWKALHMKFYDSTNEPLRIAMVRAGEVLVLPRQRGAAEKLKLATEELTNASADPDLTKRVEDYLTALRAIVDEPANTSQRVTELAGTAIDLYHDLQLDTYRASQISEQMRSEERPRFGIPSYVRPSFPF